MSDKIERLYEKRYAALIEKIEASFVKNNAEQEYLEKVKIFDEIEEQISIEERKAYKIFGTLESNWDYKMAKNNLIGARDKLDSVRNYLERLIAKEAENDATKH